MKAKRPARPVTPAPHHRRPTGVWLLWILAVGLPIAAVSLWLARGAVEPPAVPPAATPDSIARLEPWRAYERALALGESRRFYESLPFFRHALATPPEAWEPYCAFGTSLFHATHQGHTVLGHPQPVTRSSFERVTLLKEAALQLEIAERLARTPKDQAFVISAHAQQLGIWGLTWNAVSQYARAAVGAPLEKRRAGAYLDRLQNPLGSPAPEPDPETELPPR